MSALQVNPDCLREYAARARMVADDLGARVVPEVNTAEGQLTGAAVTAVHEAVSAHAGAYRFIADALGATCDAAADEYVETDEINAAALKGAP